MALLVFALLAAWACGPALFSGGRFVCAGDNPDLWAHLWIFWRAKFALAGNDLGYTVSHLLTYPGWVREPMALFDLLLPLLSAPLQLFSSPAVAYNLLVFLGLTFTGWAGYMLTAWTSGQRSAGYIGGVAIAMNPFLYRQLAGGYAEYAWWGFLPLTVWLYLKSLERAGRLPAFSYAASFLAMSLMSVYCAACFAAFALMSLLNEAVSAAFGRANRLARALKTQAAAAIVMAPVLVVWGGQLYLMDFKGMELGRSLPAPGTEFTDDFHTPEVGGARRAASDFLAWRLLRGSLDIKSLLVPDPSLSLAGSGGKPAQGAEADGLPDSNGIFESERVYQAEWWLVLCLAALALFAGERMRRLRAAAWAATGLVFLAVALGPYPVWDGRAFAAIHLPYAWLYMYAPGFSRLVIPARAFFGTVMCLAVLAAQGWTVFAGFAGRKLTPRVGGLFDALGATLLFVFFAAAGWRQGCLPQQEARIPDFYRRIAADGRKNAVLEMPYSRGRVIARMYAQTLHEKPVFRGLPAQEWTKEHDMRGIYDNALIMALENPAPGGIDEGGIAFAAESLRGIGFGWLVLHTDGYESGNDFRNATRTVEEAFGPPAMMSPEALVWRLE